MTSQVLCSKVGAPVAAKQSGQAPLSKKGVLTLSTSNLEQAGYMARALTGPERWWSVLLEKSLKFTLPNTYGDPSV